MLISSIQVVCLGPHLAKPVLSARRCRMICTKQEGSVLCSLPVMVCWHQKFIYMSTTLIDLFELLLPQKHHLLNAAAYFGRNKYTTWHHAVLIQELLKHAPQSALLHCSCGSLCCKLNSSLARLSRTDSQEKNP